MRPILPSTLLALTLLAACGDGDRPSDETAAGYAQEESLADVAPAPMVRQSAMSDKMVESAADPAVEGQAPADRLLAYEYSAGLRLPAKSVRGALAGHEERCRKAGPAQCQVVSSSLSSQSEQYVYARLEIRAAAAYMTPFRDGLAAEAKDADGELTSMNASAEDLTRQITDTGARLDAQRTLRERLLLLLSREQAEVGDLLQIERELARVQGEIESAEGWLKTLQSRVAMDRMTVTYESAPVAVGPNTTRPLRDAIAAFFGTIADSLGDVILFIGRMIPWLLVIVPGLWLLRRVLGGRKRA